jgi:hypothetical protein
VDEAAGRFSETHRRTLGLCLAMMQKLIAQVRELGFDSALLIELETDLARIDEEVEAIRPAPPAHQVRASLAELLLLTYEMRPRALKAYGEVAEDNARYLEQKSARLTELVQLALDQLEGQSEQEVSDRAVPEDPRRDRR